MKLLIVEDEEILLKDLAYIFTNEAFVVIEARDGKEGLEKALKEHPDLILLDLTLPRVNGIAMLDQLRKDEWGKTVPVIILTNNTSTSFMQQAIARDSFEYMIKTDWTLDGIVKKVKERLGML